MSLIRWRRGRILKKLAHRVAGIHIIPCPAEQAGVLDQFDELRKEARSEILIANPSITLERLEDQLSDCLEKGVKVRVLTKMGKKGEFGTSKETVKKLSRLLGKENVRLRDTLHAKFFVFDEECAFITSANLVKGAFYNDEIGVVIRTEDAVRELKEYFEELWRHSRKL